jgi:hypothetical protein
MTCRASSCRTRTLLVRARVCVHVVFDALLCARAQTDDALNERGSPSPYRASFLKNAMLQVCACVVFVRVRACVRTRTHTLAHECCAHTQWRQRGSNCCQITTPVLMIVTLVIIQVCVCLRVCVCVYGRMMDDTPADASMHRLC